MHLLWKCRRKTKWQIEIDQRSKALLYLARLENFKSAFSLTFRYLLADLLSEYFPQAQHNSAFFDCQKYLDSLINKHECLWCCRFNWLQFPSELLINKHQDFRTNKSTFFNFGFTFLETRLWMCCGLWLLF